MAAYTRKQYSGAARNTTTTTLLTNVGTTVDIAATTGWPEIAGIPFYVVINPSSIFEEKCLATISGSTLTLVRAQDDTTASEHPIGSIIYPVFTANDADEANELVSKLTTAGDLLTTDGTNLLRLGVGPNGYFLKASSSASAGIEWASIPTINSLDDIGDVTITAPADGEFLAYDSSASVWVNQSVQFITVSDSPPTAGVVEGDLWYNSLELELYTYYSGAWVQTTDSSSGVQEIYELVDVLIDDPVYGETLVYNGTEWENGPAGSALTLENARVISLSGDVSGSVSFDGSQNVNIATTVQQNSIALGTDTTGNYMSDLTQGTGVTITHTPSEGSSATIAIGQAVGTSASVTFANINTTGDLVVGGDLTVNGTTTTLNTEMLEIEDNIIVLNSNVSTSPVLNAGIEIERGTSDNVSIRWNETSDKWEITEDGSAYLEVATTTDISTASLTSISEIPDVSTAYQIGDTGPAGGKIFITPDTVGNTTGMYFEASPSASQVQRSWSTGGNQSLAVSGADGTAIGTGSQNTIDIVAQSGNVSATSAAVYASGYEYGGFSDWFLPSIDELQEIYDNESSVDGVLSDNYWSSTEHSATQAKYENLGDGGQGFSAKSNALYVRPVRAFNSPATGDFLKWSGSYWTNDPINLGTDTTGNYMSDLTQGTGVTITHTPGEGSNATIAIGQAVGTSASVTFANVTADLIGNVTGNASTVTNGIYTSSSINALVDVDTVSASPTSGQFLKWNGSNWVNDAVDLGTDTTGNYMVDVSASTGISISHTQGEGSTATVSTTGVQTLGAKAGNYTLAAGDSAETIIIMDSSSANDLTVPPASSVAFGAGTSIAVVQRGTGKTRILAGAGVTLLATPGVYLRARYSSCTLVKTETANEWFVIGDLATS